MHLHAVTDSTVLSTDIKADSSVIKTYMFTDTFKLIHSFTMNFMNEEDLGSWSVSHKNIIGDF